MMNNESLSNLFGISVEYFEEIDSTNLYCKRLISNQKPVPDLVISRCQTNGQGRCGKKFYSPDRTGLYATFVFPRNTVEENDLTPKVALAAARAIDTVFNISTHLKWVNDIYFRERKISGILCQKVNEYFLIGIGINIQKPKSVPEDLKNRFGYIVESADTNTYVQLIECILNELKLVFTENHASVLSEYRKRCIHIGRKITIEVDSIPISGICLGIGDDFSLIVESEGRNHHFTSGYMTI